MSSDFNVRYDQSLDAVVMQWSGYFTSAQFKEGTEEMLSQLIEFRSHKVLALIRDLLLIGSEEQQWMEKDFLPRAISHGLKACAILSPFNHFGKVSVENITWKIDKDKLVVNLFEREDDARNWLQELRF